MNGSASRIPVVQPIFIACVLFVASWLAAPAPTQAAQPRTAIVVNIPFADSDTWGVRRLFGGMNSRTRIIQIAVAFMCLGLFILMRKFTV